MKEIKIRFYNKKNGQWLELKDILKSHLYLKKFGNPFEDSNLIPCEYTGLKDKNGKEIYEGDILEDDKGNIFVIIWEDGFAHFTEEYHKANSDTNWNYPYPRSEIIGNKFENPELLK